MNTYAMKCPKCNKWSAKSTYKLLDYRFECTCGKSVKIYTKSKKFIGFNLPKDNIKQINSLVADKIIRELNNPITDLNEFFSYSVRA